MTKNIVAPAPDSAEITKFELGQYRLWKGVLRARLLDEASASFQPDPDELEQAWHGFCKNHQVEPGSSTPVPHDFVGCPPDKLKASVERDLRIGKWKKALFEPEAKAHFHIRQPALDRVVYSLLRVKDAGLARELWFRLKEGEATFAELAPKYASGNEIYTGGIVGPVAYGSMYPALAEILRTAHPGKLLKPLAVAEWYLVARVEHQLPAEFDDATKAQMIEELTQMWIEERRHGRSTA
jgi:parvulin-like peptidyl-prolyl isomerase